MFQVSSDSIQRPAHDNLDPRAASIKKKPVKTRPAILRPAHLVGVFRMDGPAPRLAVATELEELVFARLGAVGGADAGVNSGLHGSTTFTFNVALNPGSGQELRVEYTTESLVGDTATAGTDYQPTSGTVNFDGHPMREPRREIAIVFQVYG